MPAAKPSKAVISNAIAAAKASGFMLTSITIGSDGSLTINISDIDGNITAEGLPKQKAPRKFGEARV